MNETLTRCLYRCRTCARWPNGVRRWPSDSPFDVRPLRVTSPESRAPSEPVWASSSTCRCRAGNLPWSCPDGAADPCSCFALVDFRYFRRPDRKQRCSDLRPVRKISSDLMSGRSIATEFAVDCEACFRQNLPDAKILFTQVKRLCLEVLRSLGGSKCLPIFWL